MCRVAKTVEEAKQLLEEGFDYVTEIEAIEWVVKDKWTLIVKRIDAQAKNRKGAHGR